MRLKLVLVVLLILWAVPALAEQNERAFGDFVGHSSGEVMAAYGPPDNFYLYGDNQGLVMAYDARLQGARSYRVEYHLVGAAVIGVTVETGDGPTEFVPVEFSAGQMGVDLHQVLTREGLPRKQMRFLLETGLYEELIFDGRIAKKQPIEKTVILENGRVCIIRYNFPEYYRPDLDFLLAFARELDAGLMRDWTKDAVWLLRDTTERPWSEDLGPRRWVYVRFIMSDDMYVNLITFSTVRILGLEFADRTARGMFMNGQIEMHDKMFLEYWQDAERDWLNSGNLEKLEKLLEARANL